MVNDKNDDKFMLKVYYNLKQKSLSKLFIMSCCFVFPFLSILGKLFPKIVIRRFNIMVGTFTCMSIPCTT